MDVGAYFRRIRYAGPTRPTLETLRAVQYAHAIAIPYETFDIFLGERIVNDPAAAFDKIVGEGRGGWCYEHNGLLGLALQELGFEVTRLTADGDEPATHLSLRVEVPGEGAFVCDPGFSDAPLHPFRLQPGSFEQNGFTSGLEVQGAARFRFVNHPLGLAPGYVARPADEEAMAQACDRLQGPGSRFAHVPVVCIHEPDGVVQALAGRMLRTVRPDRREVTLVESPHHYVELLAVTFNLHIPEATRFWPDLVRHYDALQRQRAEAGAR